jgi:hypothetical protein
MQVSNGGLISKAQGKTQQNAPAAARSAMICPLSWPHCNTGLGPPATGPHPSSSCLLPVLIALFFLLPVQLYFAARVVLPLLITVSFAAFFPASCFAARVVQPLPITVSFATFFLVVAVLLMMIVFTALLIAYMNKWTKYEHGLYGIGTEPKFGTGQYAFLVQSPDHT